MSGVYTAAMLLVLALLASQPASADQVIEGDAVRIYYDTIGTWNDHDAGKGFQALHDGTWVDWAYWGYPWQLLAFQYRSNDTTDSYYANSNTPSATCTVSGEADISTADWAISSYTYSGESLDLVQTEAWQRDSSAIRVNYHLTAGTSAVERLAVYFEVDPDPDGASGDYTTENDVLDTDGDGIDDLVVSTSSAEGYTLGFGACSPATSQIGHNASWSTNNSATPTLTDNDGASADSAMGIQMVPGVTMAPGEEGDLTFVVIEGTTLDDVEAQWATTDLCGSCDADGDGHQSTWCGGDDCDDTDAAAFPGAHRPSATEGSSISSCGDAAGHSHGGGPERRYGAARWWTPPTSRSPREQRAPLPTEDRRLSDRAGGRSSHVTRTNAGSSRGSGLARGGRQWPAFSSCAGTPTRTCKRSCAKACGSSWGS